MKTQFFTSGGKKWEYFVNRLVADYKVINNIDIRVITDAECERFRIYKRKFWIKCFLWRIADADTERIVWLDCDMEVRNPLDRISEADFSGVLDYEDTAVSDKKHFHFEGSYFNVGFFTARRVTEGLFEKVISQFDNPVNGGCEEQAWISKIVGNVGNVEVLDRKYNFLHSAPGWVVNPDIVHYHFAGFERKWMMPGAELTPFRIETEDYILTEHSFIARKGVTPNNIWRKHGIQGVIMKSLPNTDGIIKGKKMAIRSFEVVALQLDVGEMDRLDTLEYERLQELEDAKRADASLLVEACELLKSLDARYGFLPNEMEIYKRIMSRCSRNI